MSGFQRHGRSGAALATFAAYEADLLRSLCRQLNELLRDGVPKPPEDPLEAALTSSDPVRTPEDEVLQRLLPAAYEDAELAAEFRRFTDADLRSDKASRADRVVAALEEAGLPPEPEADLWIDLELDGAAAQDWVMTLTDLRLALGTRLGVTAEDEQQWLALPEDDPTRQAWQIYQWLGFLSETLLESMTG